MTDPISFAPRFSFEEAKRFAQEAYGVVGSIQKLPGYSDQNFLLETDGGEKFVLKISNSVKEREKLDFENKALEYLASIDESMVPCICSTLSGEQLPQIKAGDGTKHYVRMITFLPGILMAEVNPRTSEFFRNFGGFLGRLDTALEGFSHPAEERYLRWDIKNAPKGLDLVDHIPDLARRAIAVHFLTKFEREVTPRLPQLRRSIIHSDANTYNVMVNEADGGMRKVTGIFDFGDLVKTCTIFELAIAIAYAVHDQDDPLSAAAEVIGGYHEVYPLTELELEVLFASVCARMAFSVTNSIYKQGLEPDNKYLTISERPNWEALEVLINIHPQFIHYVFREACDLPPCPQSHTVVEWLKNNTERIGRVVEPDMKAENMVIFDLSVGSPIVDMTAEKGVKNVLRDRLDGLLRENKAQIGVGRYNEARLWHLDYAQDDDIELVERETIHLGVDLFLEAGSAVYAPLEGVVHSVEERTLILRHEFEEGKIRFYSVYGNLSEESIEGLSPGIGVKKNDEIGVIGESMEDEGLPPHLHFQVAVDLFEEVGDLTGFENLSGRADGGILRYALPRQREVWLSICPDPNLILGIPEDVFPAGGRSREEIVEIRERHLGKSYSTFYREPIKMVRGMGQYLFDEEGRAYLDGINNIAHVGHGHPRVVEAGQRQMAVLNTTTRFLHDNLAEYARRLCATLPEPLRVCFFVCTGSEANELALRMARMHTGRKDIVVVEGAYHGNTSSLIELSPYKFDGPGGEGAADHIHKVMMPDTYRGMYKGDDPEAGAKYAREVQKAIERAGENGREVAAFFSEPLLGCGGQIVPPEGYLREAYRFAREAGAVCVADEVQVGFGRVGTHFWGFETQGVAPDIVTMGKPMGNGHPVAAVITTPEIAESFHNGMEYFNSFGGNPVSCAVGLAVLDVIEEEKLQENAMRVGAYLKAGLEGLMEANPLIGEVRGLGLFVGVEFEYPLNYFE